MFLQLSARPGHREQASSRAAGDGAAHRVRPRMKLICKVRTSILSNTCIINPYSVRNATDGKGSTVAQSSFCCRPRCGGIAWLPPAPAWHWRSAESCLSNLEHISSPRKRPQPLQPSPTADQPRSADMASVASCSCSRALMQPAAARSGGTLPRALPSGAQRQAGTAALRGALQRQQQQQRAAYGARAGWIACWMMAPPVAVTSGGAATRVLCSAAASPSLLPSMG